jgi:hypothetical protein
LQIDGSAALARSTAPAAAYSFPCRARAHCLPHAVPRMTARQALHACTPPSTERASSLNRPPSSNAAPCSVSRNPDTDATEQGILDYQLCGGKACQRRRSRFRSKGKAAMRPLATLASLPALCSQSRLKVTTGTGLWTRTKIRDKILVRGKGCSWKSNKRTERTVAVGKGTPQAR